MPQAFGADECVLAEPHIIVRSTNSAGAGVTRARSSSGNFFTSVAFEAEVRDGARMKRAWTDHGLELGCGSRRADASGAGIKVANSGADERRNLSARAIATP
jgi:hypothetical protein